MILLSGNERTFNVATIKRGRKEISLETIVDPTVNLWSSKKPCAVQSKIVDCNGKYRSHCKVKEFIVNACTLKENWDLELRCKIVVCRNISGVREDCGL